MPAEFPSTEQTTRFGAREKRRSRNLMALHKEDRYNFKCQNLEDNEI